MDFKTGMKIVNILDSVNGTITAVNVDFLEVLNDGDSSHWTIEIPFAKAIFKEQCVNKE